MRIVLCVTHSNSRSVPPLAIAFDSEFHCANSWYISFRHCLSSACNVVPVMDVWFILYSSVLNGQKGVVYWHHGNLVDFYDFIQQVPTFCLDCMRRERAIIFSFSNDSFHPPIQQKQFKVLSCVHYDLRTNSKNDELRQIGYISVYNYLPYTLFGVYQRRAKPSCSMWMDMQEVSVSNVVYGIEFPVEKTHEQQQ